MSKLLFQRGTLAFALAAGVQLTAQATTGNLSGTVTDTEGRPIKGARVALQAPEMIGTRVLTTDAKGRYRAPLLPVSTYTLTVSAPDFLGKTAHNVRVGIGAEAETNFRLAPIALAGAKVEVVSAGEILEAIDNPTVSTNLPMETLQRLAVERTADGALALTPGYNIEGMRGSYNTGYTLNGIETRDPKSNMALYQTVPEAIEEIQVVLSPMHARYGRVLGGTVNTVTKSGSNQLIGSLTINASRPAWDSNRQGFNLFANAAGALGLNYSDDLTRTWNWTLGGPIIKDRVWFFLSGKITPDSGNGTFSSLRDLARQQAVWATYGGSSPLWTLNSTAGNATRASSVIDNYLLAGPGGAYVAGGTDLMDAGYTFAARTQTSQQDLKITAAVSPSHVVSLAMFRTKTTTIGAPAGALNREMVGRNNANSKGWNLGWKGVFGSSLSAEFNLTKTDREKLAYPGPTGNPVSVIASFASKYSPTLGQTDLLNSVGYASVLRSTNPNWPEGSGVKKVDGNLRYYLDWMGTHDIDFGFDTVQNYDSSSQNYGSSNEIIYTGGYYRDPSKGAFDPSAYLFPTMVWSGVNSYGNTTSWGDVYSGVGSLWNLPIGPAPIKLVGTVSPERGRTRATGIYLNDGWTLGKRLHVMLGLRYNIFSAVGNSGIRIDPMSRLDPRFMIKFDPTGDGRQYFSLTMARYSQEFSVGFFGSGGLSASPYNNAVLVGWKGIPGQAAPGAPSTITDASQYVKYVSYEDLLNPANWDTTNAISWRSDLTRIKKQDLEVPFADEVTLNYTRAITGGNVRISLAHKIYRKEWNSYVDTGKLDFYSQSVNPLGSGAKSSYMQNVYWTSSPFHTTYDTLEMGWNQELTSRLFWMGTVTLSRRAIDKSFADVYNYAYVKALNGLTAANEDQYVTKGLQSETRNITLGFSYRVPVLAGEVTFGLNGTYYLPNIVPGSAYNAPGRSSTYFANWPSMTSAASPYAIENITNTSYSRIYEDTTSFHGSSEAFSLWNFKVGFRAPIGTGRTCITGSLRVMNIFNQTVLNPPYPITGDSGYYMGPQGYMLRGYSSSNKVPVGSRGEGSSAALAYVSSLSRRAGEVTLGITF
ncbi:MAG TPA: carboxypeptidase regulatory-like domain-containing protein [Holophaga sp.]|nr:carboxypeptidase regulatory-like domain-containing protein [Holophaga sp.]